MVYAVLEDSLAGACYKGTHKLRSLHFGAPANKKKAFEADVLALVETTAKDKGGELPQGWKKVPYTIGLYFHVLII
jgi:hypothetical protein